MKLLEGKVAVVTGAARGIGKAIALEFAKEGADVAFTDLAIDENGKATEAEIAALGVKAKGYASNAANFEETHEVIDRIVKDFGRIDILVNNAGRGSYCRALDHSDKRWEDIIRLNLTAAFFCSKAVAKQMLLQESGTIVNISSRQGQLPSPGQVAYAAAKAGVNSLTRTLAWELAPHIRVNAVAPGPIWTEETAKGLEGVKDQIIAEMPRRRVGSAEDVALAVLYLASPASDFVTGKTIEVDGGAEFSARLTPWLTEHAKQGPSNLKR